jgi:bifunctional DNase/RNase
VQQVQAAAMQQQMQQASDTSSTAHDMMKSIIGGMK